MSKARYEDDDKKMKRRAAPNAGLERIYVQCDSDSEKEKKALIGDFNHFFGGKQGYKPPINEKNWVVLSFPKLNDAEDFFISQASKGKNMVILDGSTNPMKVMGYSNGDGTLYHADGSELKTGDKLKASDTPYQDFEMPEPRSKYGM